MIKRISWMLVALTGILLLNACKAPSKVKKTPTVATTKRLTATDYITRYKADAIHEMKEYGIPAAITLAQGMLESDYGNSDLAVKANNHFGIKCHKDWDGPIYRKDDDTKDECFRKYKNVLESYKDHSRFLKKGKRYEALFKISLHDYKAWAKGLKDAGYATDPNYANRLIKLIEEHQLNEL